MLVSYQTISRRLFVELSLLFYSFNLFFDCSDASQTAEQHLEMGKKMLAAGQLADALSHYHAAIDLDPKNYQALYRRATVYLAMGKSKSAMPDLDKVVELKPDFTSARLQRGNVLVKQGKLTDAEADYTVVLKKEPGNQEAQEKLAVIGPLRERIEEARSAIENTDYQLAIELLTSAIETCPWDPELKELRADCYEAIGDYFKAIHDIRPTNKLRNDNTAGYLRISLLHYRLGDAEDSLNEIRECLRLDPDHKECFTHYKKVKKLVKQTENTQNARNSQEWEECLSGARKLLKTEAEHGVFVLRARQHICHCTLHSGSVGDTLKACDEVLAINPDDMDALCSKAEARVNNGDYEEGIKAYQEALEKDKDFQRAKEGLDRAQKLLKQSQKRDYYKILGVKKNARKNEIIKAYRKLAMEWHPDKFQDGPEKEAAQKKFIDIAAAKEVLTDPEKREQFDQGNDPLDAEQQAQQQQNPFWHHQGGGGQGFNPFGQDGFSFKFHF